MTPSSLRVLVRGAGVSGLCVAVVLAERGARVILREVGSGVGAGASGKAGGMLSPWIEQETAPPGLTERTIPSIAWWRARVPDVSGEGSLVFALGRDRQELDRFARRTAGHERLDAAAIAALEPDLAGRFERGLFFPGEAHLDPRRALPALAERLRGLGGDIQTGDETATAEVDAVVDCTGHGARSALPGLRGVRGEMLMLRAEGIVLRRPVRLLHPRFPLYVVPRGDGRFMLGATMIESEDRGEPRVRSVVELLNAAFTLHPAFGDAEILEMRSDLRPSFNDNMPALHEVDGVLHVNGMFRHGFLMAPVLADAVAHRLLGG
ncbi:FAD-dependent oxidoreductase [Rhizosaccharibacter radicis]|uniref:FAD-dependent oxidoreductase n=1 Tax=Rhizosaccharibacter radicis TaxID=2782605 RepID=A0ABT1VYD1_9PROT|nr:FAD-dependent oxidoreductase [Acetobacteraceae bacterium KSS12]